MGSSYKRSILEDQLANVLKQWHGRVRDKKKRDQTPKPENNGDDKNNGDIDSGESSVQPEIDSEFRFSSRQTPVLQEVSIQNQTER